MTLRFTANGLITAVVLVLFTLPSSTAPATQDAQEQAKTPTTTVRPTEDFAVNGAGDAPAWKQAEWIPLQRRAGGQLDYTARFKTLYSKTGIYFLIDGSDARLTATFTEDFENLWTEDVFEVFLWTDEKHSIYFEYEISPLNYELPIIVPNFDGKFLGWRPWHYEGDRKVRKATHAIGGEKKSGAAIEGWRAEFFIPFDLLRPLQNVPPTPGTTWRANVYRVDHDSGKSTAWFWARVGRSFHEFKSFGTLRFE